MNKLAVLIVVSCLFLQTVTAATAQTISVTPAFQPVTLEENQPETTATIEITNTANQALSLEVLPNSVDQENLSGKINFELFSGAANEVFPFLSFSTDRVTLNPNQTATVSAIIRNHTSLRPGGTYVAVIFRTLVEQPSNKQVVVPAVASTLLITKKGGELYNLSLKEVTGLPSTVTLSLPNSLGLLFSNDGNVHIQPRGTLKLTGELSELHGQSTVNESSLYILPGRQRLLSQTIRKENQFVPFDLITVEITGTAGEGRTPYSFQDSFIYISPWLVGGLLGIGIVYSPLQTLIKQKKLTLVTKMLRQK